VSENIRLDCEFSVSKDSMGNDHLPINTMIRWPQQSTTQPCLTSRKRNMKHADWTKYTTLIEESLSPRDQSVPLIYSELENIMSSAADYSIPYIKIPNSTQPGKHPYVNWWTEECSIAVKNRKIVNQEVLKNGNEHTIEAYYKNKYAPRETYCRKPRKKVGKKYTQTFNATKPTKVIWGKVKAFQKGWSRPQSSPEGTLNLTYHKHICPDYVPEENEVTPNLITTASHHPNHQPFTLQELNDVVKHIKDSATGTDINYSMIKWLPDIGHTHLLQLYNSFWNSGCFQYSWKQQKLVPIPKSHKPRTDIGSYRPIALTSCVAKVFEHLVKRRIENFVEGQKLLTPQFTGFRKSYSTICR
jgi:hypothetical protein